MALIKSTILSAIRGSVNGAVFSQNKTGAYMRNRTVPVNPNTEIQQEARAGLATASQAWALLTPEQRATWVTYAAATPVVNRLGDAIHLSGFNMFVRLAAYLAFVGEGGHEDAPTTPGLAANPGPATMVVSDDASADANSLTLTDYTGGVTTSPALYSFWISHPVSAGVKFYSGPWRYCGTRAGVDRDLANPTGFTINTTQYYFARLRYMSNDYKLANQVVVGPVKATNVP
jgi:hypothetical protein